MLNLNMSPIVEGHKPSTSETDIAALKRDKSNAFDELWARHGKKLFHVTHRITRNREDAEDAVQDCFLSALTHLEDFDGRSQFSTWLTRIAINAALMKIRRNRSMREVPIEERDDSGQEHVYDHIADPAPDPEHCYAITERKLKLGQAVRRLRPRIRAAVETRHLQDCSMKETAQLLGISQAAVKGRLFHAKVALRRSMMPKAPRGLAIRKAA